MNAVKVFENGQVDGTFIVREGYRGSGISATPIITTRVTGKGQIKLINHLMMEFES